ncbi:MAG: hypothetical protein JWN86_184, partial [Planctomycetota bacterium]|nr:hypothetical protein [Planctomycetota bacterium]
ARRTALQEAAREEVSLHDPPSKSTSATPSGATSSGLTSCHSGRTAIRYGFFRAIRYPEFDDDHSPLHRFANSEGGFNLNFQVAPSGSDNGHYVRFVEYAIYRLPELRGKNCRVTPHVAALGVPGPGPAPLHAAAIAPPLSALPDAERPQPQHHRRTILGLLHPRAAQPMLAAVLDGPDAIGDFVGGIGGGEHRLMAF